MFSNPEIRRYLWTELGPARMVLMPIIIGLVLLIPWLSSKDNPLVLAVSAFIAFALITGIWGARQTARSVLDEVIERTWDWQRMSSVHPGSLTMGKLLGSPVYAWYGGAFCLAVYVIAVIREREVGFVFQTVALMVGGAVLLQALSLLGSLLLVRRRADVNIERSGSGLLFVLLGLFLIEPFLRLNSRSGSGGVYWYDAQYALLDFGLVSIVIFGAWAILGSYYVMRAELQYRHTFWPWTIFVIFLAVYVAGFVSEQDVPRLMVGYIIIAGLTWLAAFIEPKDPVALRACWEALLHGRFREFQELTPRSVISLVITGGLLIVILAGGINANWVWDSDNARTFLTALFLLLVRDLALLLHVCLSPGVRRPEIITGIFLLVLYLVLPGILAIAGLDAWTVAFLPRGDVPAPLALTPLFLEVVAVLVLVRLRWRANARSIEFGE